MATSADLAKVLHVEPALSDERTIIDNMMQLYTYDFEPHIAGRAEGEILADGRYPEEPFLEAYWRDEGRFPYLFRVGDVLAGFALVNRHFKLQPPADWAMGEFYVHRRYRRHGGGRAAAHHIFAERHGRWELSVMRANLNGQRFWKNAIEKYPKVSDLVVEEGAPLAPSGPIYRFTTS